MTIKLLKLEILLHMILKNIKKENCDFTDLDVDYYYTVLNPSEVNEKPQFGIGSIEDDWMELEKLLTDTGRTITLDLERLGNILIAISGKVIYKEVKLDDIIKFMDSLKIDFKSLEQLFKLLIRKTIKYNSHEVELEKTDYYTVINRESLVDPIVKKNSLEKDLQELEKILNGDRLPILTDLERLGNLLIIISQYVIIFAIPEEN